ncbi:MAG: GspH/FimT family pseudopilin, partial [Pseudomonadota bacterium]
PLRIFSGVGHGEHDNAAEDPEREAQRFAARLKMAAQESIITGEAWGVSIEADGYGFYRRRAGVWTPIGARDDFFAPTDWDRETVVAVVREGASVSRREDEASEEEDRSDPEGPVVRFDSTGEATPAEIVLERSGRRFLVRVTPLGEVEFESGRS